MRSAAVIILGFSLAVGAQQTSLREARTARQERDLPKAVEKYQQALAEAKRANIPNYVYSALSELAGVVDQQGDFSGAEQLYLEASRLDGRPLQLTALGEMTLFYKKHNRPTGEAAAYSKILNVWSGAAGKKNLGYARYLAERARAESAAGLAAQSEASFRESLELAKSLSADKTVFGYVTLGSLGNSLSAHGKETEATPLLNESIDGLDRIMRIVPPIVSGAIGPAFSRAYRARHPGETGIPTVESPRVSGGNPEYSDAARKARVVGDVSLIVEISESGVPANVWVLKPLGLGLEENAVEDVRQWRFRQAMRNGVAVSNVVIIDIHFNTR